jgi:hypothetical protein
MSEAKTLEGRREIAEKDARVLVNCNEVLGGAARTLEVLGPETSVLGDTRQHSWTDLFAIVEREGEVRPALARLRTMRTRLAFDCPSNPK